MIKIVIYGNGSGAEKWRLTDPAKYLMRTEKFDIRMPKKGMDWNDLMWADIIISQGLVDKLRISMIYAAQQEYGKKYIVEFDDYFRVEKNSPFKLVHKITEAPEMIQATLKIADMVTTTTPYLASKFGKLNKNVVVLPNYMDMDYWDGENRPSDTVTLFWAGSMTHVNDFKEAVWAIKRILDEYKNVKLLTMGDPRIGSMFKGYNVEASVGIPLEFYAKKLHGSRFDIGLAPLRSTLFNRCKSNIKPLEYGICKVPSIASDVEPYRYFDGKVLIAKTKEDWYTHMKKLIDDAPYRVKMGEEMYKYVKENFDLSKNVDKFIEAYESLV